MLYHLSTLVLTTRYHDLSRHDMPSKGNGPLKGPSRLTPDLPPLVRGQTNDKRQATPCLYMWMSRSVSALITTNDLGISQHIR